ncbi:MAG: heavy metal-associated domain-containing protein [Patescibacteria group bacterium]
MSLTFTVSGLHCESCLKVIPMLLKRIEGVTNVTVEPINATTGRVELTSSDPIDYKRIQEALAAYHYSPSFDV